MKIINFLFLFLAVSFPFGQFSKIPVNFPGMPEVGFYLPDLINALIVFFWLIFIVKNRKKLYLPPFASELCLFLLVFLASWLVNLKNFNNFESLVGHFYFIRLLIYSLLPIVALNFDNEKGIGRHFFLRSFFWWTITLSFTGLIQYFLFPDIRPLFFLGWDLHYYRAVGLFLDPNFFGLLLSLGLIFLLWLFLNSKKAKKIKIALTVLVAVPLLLTYSRSSFLAVMLGIFTLLVLRKKTKWIFFLAGLFLVALIFLPRPGGEGVRLTRIASIRFRLESWQKALVIWQTSPILGVGFNNYRYASRNLDFLPNSDWQRSHSGAGVENSYLFVLATTGLVGLVSFLNLLRKIAFELCKRLKNGGDLALAGISAIFVHSFFVNSFFYPWVMIWFWFLVTFPLRESNKE